MNRTMYPVVFALLGAVVAVFIFFVWRRVAPADRMHIGSPIVPVRPAQTTSAPPEAKDFREEFLAELRTQFPSQKFSIDANDPASIIASDCRINLPNMWKRFQKSDMSHEALKGIVRDCEALWTAPAQLAHDFPKTYDEAKHRLFPQIMPPAIASDDKKVRIPLADTIVLGIVLDSERTYAYVSHETLKGWGQTADNVYADALDNLNKRSHGMQLKQFQTLGANFFAISMHDGFDAVRITLPGIKKSLGGKLGYPFYFGIPNREFLICWSGGDKQKVLQFAREKLKHDFEQEPYPISLRIFQVAADGTVAIVQEGEPTNETKQAEKP